MAGSACKASLPEPGVQKVPPLFHFLVLGVVARPERCQWLNMRGLRVAFETPAWPLGNEERFQWSLGERARDERHELRVCSDMAGVPWPNLRLAAFDGMPSSEETRKGSGADPALLTGVLPSSTLQESLLGLLLTSPVSLDHT